ncbi:histidine kinase N-terminal 7TM domain-containing protein [Rariglobus hedericola]|uniref:histidine kinase N-terminal 7TM domain-containing protein n=1 Tax=Rariglobus hedericola TaxID=2597822 RepID=UPI0013968659|nr:histidine kinase N-terminal 7TM domain-containing protein [Rariglobus hedericola]
MSTLFTYQLTALALPQAIAAGLCLIAAGFVWPLRRESTAAAWLVAVLGGAILWSFAGALEFLAVAVPAKIFWTQISYIGIVMGPISLFHFTYAHTHGGASPRRAVSVVICLIGLLVLLSAFTNSWHGLHWPEVTAVQRGKFVFANYERGPMFWVTVAYCYGFMFASSVMLAAHTISMGNVFRQQAWIIILATLAPWFTSVIYVMRLGPLPELDHTPVGFAVSGILFSWAVVRMRLFELVPVAANTLFLYIPDPVLVADPLGRLVRANLAAIQRFGRIDRHIGQPLLSGFAQHPELGAGILESTTRTDPHTFSLGDNWWTIQSTSLDEADGRARGNLIVLRDITEQKRAEIALLHAKQELEETLVRADALAQEAMAASTAKSNFLAQVSHDLRTPLHAILGMTEVLRSGPLDAAQQTEVATISDAGDALLRLINDLLDLSRIEAGRLDLAHEPFQLDDVLDQIADLLGPAAHRKGLFFAHWIEPGLPGGLRGDADRLRQALFNLVGNAVKFTERGGITVRALRDGPSLRIEITDTGRGIAPEHLANLFNPFNRGDPELARRVEGTGLGLAITRRLAEAMGGTVTVSSRPGEGTVFVLELPIVDDSAVGAGVARLTGQATGRRVAVDLANTIRCLAVIQGLRSLGMDAVELSANSLPSAGGALIVESTALEQSPAKDWIAAGCTVIALAAPESKPSATTAPLRRRSLASALLSASTPSQSPFVAPAGPRRRVLLADDNALSLRVSTAQLGQCNCEVTTVTGGLAALDQLARESYDIIVLDGQMPDLNGWEVAFRVRQWPKDALNARTPIVALTADLTPESHVRWLHAGAAVVLGKPVRTRELSETLERFTPKNEPVGLK